MKLSQSQIIVKLLESEPREFYSYELVKVWTKWGYLGLAADRRCRELAKDGIIEVSHEGKYAKYKAKIRQLSLI